MILVQVETIELASWQQLTDAIKGLEARPEVERSKQTPNKYVHTIRFKEGMLDLDLLDGLQSYVETIYEAKCEGAGVEPDELVWVLDEIVQERLAPKPPKRPAKLAELVKTTAGKQLSKLRDVALRKAIKKLDKEIESGKMTRADAYRLLKGVILGDA